MKDLKSQLQGIPVPAGPTAAPTAAVPLERRHPLLGEKAHQGTDWFRKARAVSVPGAQKVSVEAKLHAAIQQTDGVLKALKKAGRTREMKEIEELRKRWLGEREQLAWGLVKAELEALGASDKLYRSLKQGEADPVDVMRRLDKADKTELATMGKDRLKVLLTE